MLYSQGAWLSLFVFRGWYLVGPNHRLGAQGIGNNNTTIRDAIKYMIGKAIPTDSITKPQFDYHIDVFTDSSDDLHEY